MGFINESLIFCGGRSESNFPISSGCWKLERNSTEWQPSTPLPRSLSRATALAINNTLWVFGGMIISVFTVLEFQALHLTVSIYPLIDL